MLAEDAHAMDAVKVKAGGTILWLSAGTVRARSKVLTALLTNGRATTSAVLEPPVAAYPVGVLLLLMDYVAQGEHRTKRALEEVLRSFERSVEVAGFEERFGVVAAPPCRLAICLDVLRLAREWDLLPEASAFLDTIGPAQVFKSAATEVRAIVAACASERELGQSEAWKATWAHLRTKVCDAVWHAASQSPQSATVAAACDALRAMPSEDIGALCSRLHANGRRLFLVNYLWPGFFDRPAADRTRLAGPLTCVLSCSEDGTAELTTLWERAPPQSAWRDIWRGATLEYRDILGQKWTWPLRDEHVQRASSTATSMTWRAEKFLPPKAQYGSVSVHLSMEGTLWCLLSLWMPSTPFRLLAEPRVNLPHLCSDLVLRYCRRHFTSAPEGATEMLRWDKETVEAVLGSDALETPTEDRLLDVLVGVQVQDDEQGRHLERGRRQALRCVRYGWITSLARKMRKEPFRTHLVSCGKLQKSVRSALEAQMRRAPEARRRTCWAPDQAMGIFCPLYELLRAESTCAAASGASGSECKRGNDHLCSQAPAGKAARASPRDAPRERDRSPEPVD